jgi:hypothetical protein
MPRPGRRILPALLLLSATAPGIAGQAAVLDEGRFSLFLEGRAAGSETFRIQRTGMGGDARILAIGTIALDESGGRTEMAPRIEARADLAPETYRNDLTGAREARVTGAVDGGRFVVRVTSPEGESQREFRAGAGTVLLERHVAYMYYFLGPLVESSGSTITVIEPSTGEQFRLQVVSSGVEPYRLGREQLDVRHVRLEGDDRIHEVWLDDQGRVLRVEVPSRGYRAERDAS